jgi:Peptidase C13 family
MRLPAGIHAFLVLVALTVAPVGSGHAQTADAAPPKGHIVAFGFSDDLNVFHSEATRAAAILAQRYGRGSAPVVQTNRRGSGRATVASLRQALVATAARMDRDNDVLFVFLTSHGTPRGIVIKAGRRVGILTPGEFAALLRETGVRQKVVIISACYSGVFIPLADAGTFVVTAADATHPSFGCEKAATWTFFGRAFFSEAIPRTDNLPDAFVHARSAVLARERKERYEPSNPQMAGGQSFVARLRAAP